MPREPRDITPLGELLNTLAGRIHRVDLRLIDELRAVWTRDADPVLAHHCRVDRLEESTLIISCPNGAFAERVREETPNLLTLFTYLGDRAPKTLRTTVGESSMDF